MKRLLIIAALTVPAISWAQHTGNSKTKGAEPGESNLEIEAGDQKLPLDLLSHDEEQVIHFTEENGKKYQLTVTLFKREDGMQFYSYQIDKVGKDGKTSYLCNGTSYIPACGGMQDVPYAMHKCHDKETYSNVGFNFGHKKFKPSNNVNRPDGTRHVGPPSLPRVPFGRGGPR